MTVGILTEKPDAERKFAKALGGTSGTYEGQPYVITSAVGHLFEFVKPGKPGCAIDPSDEPDFASWATSSLPWDLSKLSWKRQAPADKASKLREIKAALKDCTEIVIATDVDPTGEGDLIAVEIIEELKLNTPGRKFSRMYFVDDEAPSLRKAFVERKSVPSLFDLADYRKAYYRTRFDYATMQWTRVATDCCNGALVRQGRLKTAMVKLVGDQLKAYNDYKRVPFYKSSFVDDHGIRYMDKDAPQFENRADVPMDFTESKVVVDSRENKRTPPPALLTLSGLSAKLAPMGFKAEQVLKSYQNMYEAQLLSYPRTEDRTITREQFNEMLPLVDKIAKVVGADVSKLTHREPRSSHVKDAGAHGANRPGKVVPMSLEAIESNRDYGACGRAIYELLSKNFLAMFAEDYVYEKQVGHVEKYPKYIGSSNIPRSLGFKDIFPDDEDEKDVDESSEGLGSIAKPEVYEGAPTRPTHPNQKWLFSRLDKDGIGTGATQLSTLKDILKPETRKGEKADPNNVLLKDTKGKLTLGQLGDFSWMLTPNTTIGDLSLSKRVQDNMQLIAEGTLDPEDALRGIAELVMADLPVMQANAREMAKHVNLPARRNTSEIVKGVWNGEEIGLRREIFDHTLTDDELARAFSGEEIEFEATPPKKEKSTHRMSIQRYTYQGKEYVGLRYASKPKSAEGVPLQFCGHTFTEDELARLGKGEKVVFGEVFTWPSTGNKGSATLEFDRKTKKLGFAKGVPASLGKYTFTDDERARLEAGEEVAFGEVFVWNSTPAGQKKSATLVYDKKQGKLTFVNKKK